MIAAQSIASCWLLIERNRGVTFLFSARIASWRKRPLTLLCLRRPLYRRKRVNLRRFSIWELTIQFFCWFGWMTIKFLIKCVFNKCSRNRFFQRDLKRAGAIKQSQSITAKMKTTHSINLYLNQSNVKYITILWKIVHPWWMHSSWSSIRR